MGSLGHSRDLAGSRQGQRVSEVPRHPPQQFGRGAGRRDRAQVPGESEV